MATYQCYNHPTYDATRRSSQSVHGHLDRNPYSNSCAGRIELRGDPTATYRASYTLPTPIHDVESDNNAAQRRRIQVACARCRRRKIKCSGDPGNGSGCQACRSAGADISACTFDRVGTTHKYNLGIGIEAQISPTSVYGPSGFAANLPVDSGSRPDRYSQQMAPTSFSGILDPCSLEMQSVAAPSDVQFAGEGPWSRQSTGLGDYSEMGAGYTQNLTPTTMAAFQSPPLPLHGRRLPAPNSLGAPMSPTTLTSPVTSFVSGRLAGLSISNQGDTESSQAGRRRSIQELGAASVMLPPVSRVPEGQNLFPTPNDGQGYAYQASTTEALYTSSSTGRSSSSRNALPPMLAPSTSSCVTSSSFSTPQGSGHYIPISMSTSAPSISAMMTSDRPISRPESSRTGIMSGYDWATANETHKRPSIVSAYNDGDGPCARFQPIAPLLSQPKLPTRGSTNREKREEDPRKESGHHDQAAPTQMEQRRQNSRSSHNSVQEQGY